MAERIYPTSEVRSRSWEDPMSKGQWPRGATPRPRSGAVAGRAPCLRGSGQEELLHVQGQGRQPRVTSCDSTGAANPRPRSRAAADRSYPSSEVRDGGQEEQSHIQGAVAVWVQEGLEELLHVQDQKRQQSGDTPCPRKGAAAVLCWSSREKTPHVQGKRNPSKMVSVARRHQKADTLKS